MVRTPPSECEKPKRSRVKEGLDIDGKLHFLRWVEHMFHQLGVERASLGCTLVTVNVGFARGGK